MAIIETSSNLQNEPQNYHYSGSETFFLSENWFLAESQTPNLFHIYPLITGSRIDTKALIDRYCDQEAKEKILDLANLHLRNLIIISLCNLFKKFNKQFAYYKPMCYLWKDYEILNWEKIIIEVSTEYSTFEDENKIWDELIKIIDESFNEYQHESGLQEKVINELRKKIGTSVEPIKPMND